MDVENLHQTVLDLSSFEGGGELGQGEQGLLPPSVKRKIQSPGVG